MNIRSVEYLFSRVVFPSVRSHHLYRTLATTRLPYTPYHCKYIPIRNISTELRSYEEKSGLFQRIILNFKLQLKKHKLKAAGFHLYECVADKVDYVSFIRELRMPDTFQSWFLITELHIWMIMSVLMNDPSYGRFIRNSMVEALWNDVSTRTKKLGNEQPSIIRSQILELSDQFQASLVNYDEGLLSSDAVLAGAVWRRILRRDPSCTAADIEAMVKYIRMTMLELDKLSSIDFLRKENIKWIKIKKIIEDLPR